MSDHGPSLKTYVAVFVALLVLTMVTYSAAFMDFGSQYLNVLVALGIAVTKATLVVLFFMHVKYSERLVWIFVAGGFLWLGLMIVGTLHDYWTRGWLGQ
jgi:cytochrome c oxidase subunit IV